MLIQDIMHAPVTTIGPETSLAAAYRTMKKQGIRHLPVVSEGALVGIVTDRDLRFLTRHLETTLSADDPVAGVMTAHPLTAGPLDPVEEAARLMREHKIGCLPVLDGARLVGMVTVTDLLDALVRLTGVGKPSSRLAVRLDDRPGRLADLTARIAEQGIDVRSALSYFEDDTAHLRVILRLDALNPRPLADALRHAGFEVVWPTDKPEFEE